MRAILEEHARSLLYMYCAGTVIASSGRRNRHRLNKGGNWQGNMALHRIAIIRLRYHQPTKDYVVKKTREGKGKLKIIRCIKQFIARETPAKRGARLHELRVGHDHPQQQIGEVLCVPSSHISEIECGTRNLPKLGQRAIQWINSITSTKTTRPNA